MFHSSFLLCEQASRPPAFCCWSSRNGLHRLPGSITWARLASRPGRLSGCGSSTGKRWIRLPSGKVLIATLITRGEGGFFISVFAYLVTFVSGIVIWRG